MNLKWNEEHLLNYRLMFSHV